MAGQIKGDAIILSVHDGTIWRPVACLTSNSLSMTKNVIESQTKCNPGTIEVGSGSKSYEISAEGEYIDTTSVGAQVTLASHDFLKTLYDVDTTFFWRMDTGLTDEPFYYGTSILVDLGMDAEAGDTFTTFSATIKGSGLIVTIDPS